MANILNRVEDYDLGLAYAWWKRLPVAARGVLYLPVVCAPALLTAGITLYMWRNTPGALVFGWLLSGLGQLVTIFLAWALAERWKRLWPYALVSVRVCLILTLLQDNPELFPSGFSLYGNLKFLIIIEIITLIASIELLSFLKKQSARRLSSAGDLEMGKALAQEAGVQEDVGMNPGRRCSSQTSPLSLRGLWHEFPLWMRWIYCWGVVFVPGIVAQSLLMESRVFFAAPEVFYMATERVLMIIPALYCGMIFIPSHKKVLLWIGLFICMMDSIKFALYLWATNASNQGDYLMYRYHFSFFISAGLAVYMAGFWFLRRRSKATSS